MVTLPNTTETASGAAVSSPRKVKQALCALAIGWSVLGPVSDALARRAPEPEVTQSQLSAVPLSSLPRQAQEVHRRIHTGGPFAYAKDGIVFGNRERILPRQPRGFYREYTVRTPGVRDRGPRRIVCGGKDVQKPETCFYTADHYSSFFVIDPRR